MNRKEIDEHLEAVAEYVNDDDKLVTYKWLSKELKLHVNLAKQILFEFWERERDAKRDITATFLLIGCLEEGGMRVEVLKEADLEAAKKNFSRVISEHIYSVQRSLPQIELLALTDKGDCKYSAVRCEEAVIRSEQEMESLRWGSAVLVNRAAKTAQSLAPKKQAQASVEAKPAVEKKEPKESVTKTATTKPVELTQKTAFNNLFAKAKSKQTAQKKDKPASLATTNKEKTKDTSPRKNAWFEVKKKPQDTSEKVAEKRPKDSEDTVEPPVEEKKMQKPTEQEKKPEKKIEKKVLTEKKIENKVLPEKSADSAKGGGTVSSARGKKRQSSSSAKQNSASKKRRRIIIAESSDESSGSDTRDDIEEPPSPEPCIVAEEIKRCKSPPLTKFTSGKKKVRKLVDKTFLDEKGYLVTQKEYIYESCSDHEEETPAEVPKPAPEPVVKNNKRKQASLLTFFKKS